MRKKSLSLFAVAVPALVLALAGVGCDTPPASPATAGVPAIAPAHPSPDPPPARPLIIEDAGSARADATAPAFAGGTDVGGDDAGAADAGLGSPADGGTASTTSATTVAGSDAVMAELRPKFRACYTRNGKINSRPQGRLVFSAKVSADGSVASVTSSQVQNIGGRVVTCMTDIMKGAHFTAPGRAATLELPVSFQTP